MQEKKAYNQYTAETELLASSAPAQNPLGAQWTENAIKSGHAGVQNTDGEADGAAAFNPVPSNTPVADSTAASPTACDSTAASPTACDSTAASPAAANSSLPNPAPGNTFPGEGTVLDGRYRLLKKLGTGGTSAVFLAEHLSLGNLWAVKVLPADSASLKGHLKEAEILKRLSHPMLPRVVDILEHGGSLCIVMDFVIGHTLAERLREEGPIPEATVISWMLQLCDVLHYLHAQTPEPVIYRDLKPANLIADNFGHLKLVDFGTARRFRQDEGGDTAYIGTQGYAAPEQYGLNQSDARTDIYNLGMTLFHLLTATHPVSVPHGDIERHLSEHGVSTRLSAIIRKCVQLSPSNRYRNAGVLRSELLLLAPVTPMSSGDIPEYEVDGKERSEKPRVRLSSRFMDGNRLQGKQNFMDKMVSGIGKDHSPIPLSGQARIAFVGACPGAGATFAAIAMASYLAAKKRTVAIAEMNPSGDLIRFRQQLTRLGHAVLPVNGAQHTDTAFRFGQIVYHPACRRLTDLRGDRPDVMILDLGSARTEQVREEMLRADWRFVYCPQADWKFGHVLSFLEAMDNQEADSAFFYLLPFGDKGGSERCRDIFGSRKTAGFPHVVNPFMPSPTESRQLDRLFRLAGLDN